MKRRKASFIIDDPELFFAQLLTWMQKFKHFSLGNSNQHFVGYGKYEWIAGVGGEVVDLEGDVFTELQAYHHKYKDWLFGALPYDLKNKVENLESNNSDVIDFPEVVFFRPTYVLHFNNQLLFIETIDQKPADVYAEIRAVVPTESASAKAINLKPAYSKAQYVEKINGIKEHLQFGNIYEMNFCQRFLAASAEVDPVKIFKNINKITKAPFAAFFRTNNHFVMSGSPERYLAKRGNKLISQPIKGTAKRSTLIEEDEKIKQDLLASTKERAENVMIVDLVRNDLSRTAKVDSVVVEELFGLYTFSTVHQLISTVVSEIEDPQEWAETLKNTFPMGSMTGAPKVKAMQLIEEFEDFKRGIYSGALGYISPEGDFDFNVVIRSIVYNQKNKNLIAPVGGAITILSDAEEEYEECLLKVKAMKEALL